MGVARDWGGSGAWSLGKQEEALLSGRLDSEGRGQEVAELGGVTLGGSLVDWLGNWRSQEELPSSWWPGLQPAGGCTGTGSSSGRVGWGGNWAGKLRPVVGEKAALWSLLHMAGKGLLGRMEFSISQTEENSAGLTPGAAHGVGTACLHCQRLMQVGARPTVCSQEFPPGHQYAGALLL